MYPNLKLQIFKLGVHQNRMARDLGMDESVLSKIIHGYREPSESQRRKLTNFLQVDEGWLFEKYDGVAQKASTVSSSAPQEGKDGLS